MGYFGHLKLRTLVAGKRLKVRRRAKRKPQAGGRSLYQHNSIAALSTRSASMGWQAREKEDNTKTVFKIDAHSDGPRECITRWHNVTRSPRLFRPLPRRDEQKCPTYRTVERTQKRCRSGHEEDVPKVARTWRLDKSSGEGSPRTAAVGSITAQE
eukprot:6209480-Pleurochrysis_carterae.AAC.1